MTTWKLVLKFHTSSLLVFLHHLQVNVQVVGAVSLSSVEFSITDAEVKAKSVRLV